MTKVPPTAARPPAALLDLLAVLLLVPLLGGALSTAARATTAIGTGTWSAAAAVPGEPPPGGGLPVPWSTGGPTAEAFLDVVVTGTLPLSAVTLRLAADGPDGADAVDAVACVDGTWDGAACDGTEVLLGDLTGPTDLAASFLPGGRVALRAEVERNAASRTEFTLHVAVRRDAVRPGAVRSG